jgi:hypothetical protein
MSEERDRSPLDPALRTYLQRPAWDLYFLGNHSLNRDTGFQPVLATFDFKLARFGSNNASGTGRRPVSQQNRWRNQPLGRRPGNPDTPHCQGISRTRLMEHAPNR